jgi:membrane-associated phospholipid phosphatase
LWGHELPDGGFREQEMHMIICALLGFAVILAASFIRKIPDKFEDFCIGVSIPVFVCLLLPIGAATGWLRPATLDVLFRRADMALGLDGFALTRWLLRTGWYVLVSPIYSALPLVLALGWALERSRTLLRAAVIGAVLAVPLYLLLPAAGPEYAFSNFPDPNSVAASVGWVHPRNCFPSMHLTWAILVAWNLRNPRWRWLFVFYAALMALATVACGEHYFVDILAALPFAAAVQKIAVAWPSLESKRSRLGEYAAGLKPFVPGLTAYWDYPQKVTKFPEHITRTREAAMSEQSKQPIISEIE